MRRRENEWDIRMPVVGEYSAEGNDRQLADKHAMHDGEGLGAAGDQPRHGDDRDAKKMMQREREQP